MFEIHLDSALIPSSNKGCWGLVLVKDNKVVSKYVGGQQVADKKQIDAIGLLNAFELCFPHPTKKFQIFCQTDAYQNLLNLKGSQEFKDRWEKIGGKIGHVTTAQIETNRYTLELKEVLKQSKHIVEKGVTAFGTRLKIQHLVNHGLRRL